MAVGSQGSQKTVTYSAFMSICGTTIAADCLSKWPTTVSQPTVHTAAIVIDWFHDPEGKNTFLPVAQSWLFMNKSHRHKTTLFRQPVV